MPEVSRFYGIVIAMLPRVESVKPSGDYRIALSFSNGRTGEVDLREWIVGAGGVFEPLENPDFFSRVSVNQPFGSIEWPNGVDFCPDLLYSLMTGEQLPAAQPGVVAHSD